MSEWDEKIYHEEESGAVSRIVTTIREQAEYLYAENAGRQPAESGGSRWIWVALLIIGLAIIVASAGGG